MGQSVDATGAKFQNAWYRAPSNNPSDNGVSFWPGTNGVGEQSWINPVIYNISPTAALGSSVVSGRILDASGNPVSGVRVRATSRVGVCAAATSNAKGIYALVLPAGEYWITAGAEGEYSRRVVKVVATEGTKRADGGERNVVIGNQCDIDLVRRLERSYVPCVKGGRAGLYDAVSKTVYYSQGSADFMAPPPINGVMGVAK